MILLSLVDHTRERRKEKIAAANPNSARPCASSSMPTRIRYRFVGNENGQDLPLAPPVAADLPVREKTTNNIQNLWKRAYVAAIAEGVIGAALSFPLSLSRLTKKEDYLRS